MANKGRLRLDGGHDRGDGENAEAMKNMLWSAQGYGSTIDKMEWRRSIVRRLSGFMVDMRDRTPREGVVHAVVFSLWLIVLIVVVEPPEVLAESLFG